MEAGMSGAAQEGPRDPMDAPADRFCDVVMEGGVTSGIIYASAVVELARHYRFQSIGGSSIGAFAAALTASAEYRRRHGSGAGFQDLAKLPARLAVEDGGRTKLERLFQPQPGTRRLFQIFLAMLDHDHAMTYIAEGVKEAVCQYRGRVGVLVALLAGIVLMGPLLTTSQCVNSPSWWPCSFSILSWIAAALLAVGVAVVIGVVTGVAQDFGRAVVPNGFGLCRGWDPDATADSQDLAAYLHGSIQTLAGRDPHEDVPLTFDDLWNAPASPGQMLGFHRPGGGARSIDLQVYASNLSHSRPYRFPLDPAENMGRLFFRIEELEDYFPKGIVQYLAAVSEGYAPRDASDPPASGIRSGFLELPSGNLPIVVAARLAMSFPLLISAVPLYAVNHARQSMERCWMSDGGLCSNFPIHLFDSFLPMWPTFGISLNTRRASDARRVWLPEYHTSGRGEEWDHAPEESAWKLTGFLLSLWKTTWRWNDSTMRRMPGVRDRVVRIYLDRRQGGVNIKMRGPQIEMLGKEYGEPAAEKFVAKFAVAGSPGWSEHRWVRFNNLLIALRQRMQNFRTAVDLDRHTIPLPQQIEYALQAAPLRQATKANPTLPSEKPLRVDQDGEMRALLDALTNLEQAFINAGDTEPYLAVPRPSLRMRHPT
jgi:predicted acylesterase/phospholipase RssA